MAGGCGNLVWDGAGCPVMTGRRRGSPGGNLTFMPDGGPLPPGAYFEAGVGLRFRGAFGMDLDFGLGYDDFVFVGYDHFWERDYHAFQAPPTVAFGVFRGSLVINNYNFVDGRFVVEGLGRDHIALVTHHDIRPVEITIRDTHIVQAREVQKTVIINRVQEIQRLPASSPLRKAVEERDAIQRSGGAGPRQGGVAPRPGEVTPRPGEVTPRPGAVAPRPGEVTPRPGEVTPRPGEVTPRPGEVTPRPGEVTPRPGAVAPRPGDVAPGRSTAPATRSPEPGTRGAASPSGTSTTPAPAARSPEPGTRGAASPSGTSMASRARHQKSGHRNAGSLQRLQPKYHQRFPRTRRRAVDTIPQGKSLEAQSCPRRRGAWQLCTLILEV